MLLSAVWSTDSSPLFPRPSADGGVHCHVHVCAIQGKLRVRPSLTLNRKLFLLLLQEEVSTAWKVLRTEPIVLRLRFSLSQYLDGPGKGVTLGKWVL